MPRRYARLIAVAVALTAFSVPISAQREPVAVAELRLAAEQGVAVAQYNLGRRYADGRGVPRDYVQAHLWYTLAASRSSGEERERSAKSRDDVARLMTPVQVSEAERLAREWDAAHQRN